ncbi:hypothetical protein HDU67_000066 [Dinochytrium kinnereticum]|nr:hypothetical protein HDU67_000066 [Dinochytrium kinnereticum]
MADCEDSGSDDDEQLLTSMPLQQQQGSSSISHVYHQASGSGNASLSPSPTSPILGGPGKRKPKRANHNALERKRRFNQRQALTLLKDSIPSLSMDKPSTILIMEKARDYISKLWFWRFLFCSLSGEG